MERARVKRRPMISSLRHLLFGVSLLASQIGTVTAAAHGLQDRLSRRDNVSSSSTGEQISIYWGQNSYGQATGDLAQKPLADYCSDLSADIFPIAFLYQLTTGTGGEPVINIANQQNNCTVFNGTELINCPQVGEDIKTCQKSGKKILISIGGATYTEGGFQSEDIAVSTANKIWSIFGPPSQGALRPFGDAVIDGFDFDFESTVSNIIPFGRQLRKLMAADSSKQYMLTAAPQCVFPDAADSPVLNSDVQFDALFIQFYNNFCGLQNFVDGKNPQPHFNLDVWDNWAKNTSANKDVKLFVGVPAGQTAAGSGYTPASGLKPIIDFSKTFSSFGGVMMWDASQAYANKGFVPSVRAALGGGDASSTPSSAANSSAGAASMSTLTSTSTSTSIVTITGGASQVAAPTSASSLIDTSCTTDATAALDEYTTIRETTTITLTGFRVVTSTVSDLLSARSWTTSVSQQAAAASTTCTDAASAS